MKPRQFEILLTLATVAAVTIITSSATPITSNDLIASRIKMNDSNPEKQTMERQKVIHTCLRIAPNLQPCNFDSEATWRSRSSEILHSDPPGSGYPMGELPEFHPDGSGEKILTVEPTEQKDGTPISSGEKNLEEFELYENDLATTVVYYLEGCLPARLPFDLPSCPIDELQAIQMNKLVPFQLPDVQDALIFPEIDVKQIEFSHRQSRAPPASQSHEESKENNIPLDPSSKKPKLWDHPSSLTVGNGNGLIVDTKSSTKGVQDFHKTIPKSSMTPRTGTASTKYANILPAASSGLTSMVPAAGFSWASEKDKERSVVSRMIVKNLGSIGKVQDGSRELEGVLVPAKNRVQ